MSTNTSGVVLSPATMEALASIVASAVAVAMTEALPRLMAQTETVIPASAEAKPQPKPSAKAKRSTKAQSKTEPKVARFVETGTLVEARLDSLPKGALFSVRSTGAQYKVMTPKGSAVVKGYHPKGETYDFDGARTVFAVR